MNNLNIEDNNEILPPDNALKDCINLTAMKRLAQMTARLNQTEEFWYELEVIDFILESLSNYSVSLTAEFSTDT